jgi:RND family efflux transporter MFP subunit
MLRLLRKFRPFLPAAAMLGAVLPHCVAVAAQDELASGPVQTADAAEGASFDGVVEAVRQTVVAAQVAGAIVALEVRAGDAVKAGQVLARIDARAAEQTASSSDAQVHAARASLEVATKEFERQRHLFQKGYISQAALDRAEAQFKANRAEVSAQLAQAGVARTQSGFFVVKAPYAGVVAEVPVTLGDMAMPGRALLTLYDPAALRVSATIPESAAAGLAEGRPIKVELPVLAGDRRWQVPRRVTLLPTVDAATHTAHIRLDLAASLAGVSPGMFARVWLPTSASSSARLYVPRKAIVRRAEMTGVYVIDPAGRPVLRQVRLGRTANGTNGASGTDGTNDTVEVLAGVATGERVALDPQAAARVR